VANPRSSDVLLALSLDCRLTPAHLAALSPEQIKALIEAADTVVSLTNLAEQAIVDRAGQEAVDEDNDHPLPRDPDYDAICTATDNELANLLIAALRNSDD
jgi:hypothetical protein